MITRNLVLHPALRDTEVAEDGYAGRFHDLRFIVSVAVEDDGKEWMHASVSRRDRKMPTYENLKDLKRICIGEHQTALQVFPPLDKHVNLAGERGIEVLHLWCCLSADVTPDFTRGGDSI